MATLKWNGAKIAAKAQAASVLAVDRTMAECVVESKATHPWRNRTGFLEGSIFVMQPATPDGAEVKGRWGSDANYSLFLEIGTSREGSGAPRAEVRAAEADGNMSAVSPPQPEDDPLMEPRPTYRPAADAQYKLLGQRIGQAFRGEELA